VLFFLQFLFWFTYSSFGLGAGPVFDCECLFVAKRCATLIDHRVFGPIGYDCGIFVGEARCSTGAPEVNFFGRVLCGRISDFRARSVLWSVKTDGLVEVES